MADRILIIEDEERIARVLQLELVHEGYEVDLANNGEAGLRLAVTYGWSCILLDLQLPGTGGFEVLEAIRKQDTFVPVLIITARDAVSDKVRGLDQGANDYVTKPFEYEELSARIRALIRSAKQSLEPMEGEVLRVDALTADTAVKKVYREGDSIELTPREFDLLAFLMRNRGVPQSREKILAEVWGFDFAGETNLVDVYIRYLRQKIDKSYKKKLILTKRGVGYSIEEPV
jgi:DNA-binding response OmpR family regulator